MLRTAIEGVQDFYPVPGESTHQAPVRSQHARQVLPHGGVGRGRCGVAFPRLGWGNWDLAVHDAVLSYREGVGVGIGGRQVKAHFSSDGVAQGCAPVVAARVLSFKGWEVGVWSGNLTHFPGPGGLALPVTNGGGSLWCYTQVLFCFKVRLPVRAYEVRVCTVFSTVGRHACRTRPPVIGLGSFRVPNALRVIALVAACAPPLGAGCRLSDNLLIPATLARDLCVPVRPGRHQAARYPLGVRNLHPSGVQVGYGPLVHQGGPP